MSPRKNGHFGSLGTVRSLIAMRGVTDFGVTGDGKVQWRATSNLALPPYRVRSARFQRPLTLFPLPIRWWPSGRVRGIRASHQLGGGVGLRPRAALRAGAGGGGYSPSRPVGDRRFGRLSHPPPPRQRPELVAAVLLHRCAPRQRRIHQIRTRTLLLLR